MTNKNYLWKNLPDTDGLIHQLKSNLENEQFEYNNKENAFSSITKQHFKKEKKYYGVYIFRKKEDSTILYIGKAGTFEKKNHAYKNQGLRKRLSNRSGKISRNRWVEKIFDENGPLVLEYLLCSDYNPTPTFLESLLLQSYLQGNGTLPRYNKVF